MEISSSNLRFHISLIAIDLLKPHEEIIESSVRSLAKEIEREKEVRDPIMVDQDDYIILDGMHRFNSLRSLGCKFAPCCLLDYNSDQIKVGAWYRLFQVKNAEQLAEDVMSSNHLTYSKKQVNLQNMDTEPHRIIITGTGAAISLPGNMDGVEEARTCALLEKEIAKRGYKVEYLSETMAVREIRSEQMNLMILLPIFTKKQIRECALQGRLLPHKATRHVIPSRPLRVDVPLSLLRDANISLTEANRKMDELLNRKNVIVKPPGSIVDGRRYDEELLIFS